MISDPRVDDVGYAPLPIRPPNAVVTARADGSIVIEQRYAQPEPWPSIPHLFRVRAAEYPDRGLVARRRVLPDGRRGDWLTVSYSEVLERSRRLAQWMLDQGLGAEKSIMVLSGPSADHLIINLAAQMARVPYAPISSNFSLASSNFARLDHAVALCRPAVVFADDAHAYRTALASLPREIVRLSSRAAADGSTMGLDAILASTEATAAVDASIEMITPDQHAKTIFTSGSTGKPKAVIQTQRMLTAVIRQHDALYIYDDDHRDRGHAWLSWLPWSHVGPNNMTISDVINESATLYIDDGKPIPGQFEETIRNLREIHPVEYGSAPIFYAHLAAAMETDDALRDGFFSQLRYLSYSTAGLSQDLFDRLQRLAIAATGQKIPIITKYGATESQGMTLTSWPMEEIGPIGLPFPGVTVKLTPVGNKLEIRVKGDTITPGYLDDAEATAAAFDEEGFYRTGDAGVLYNPQQPERGISFDGRVSENFKLSTGTWVSVGPLRLSLIEALAPIALDVVITGENRDHLGAMIWLRAAEAQALAGTDHQGPIHTAPLVRTHLRDALRRFNAEAGGSSRRIARLVILDQPASGDELAEKGYINQREVQKRRGGEVARLYATLPDEHVLIP